MIEPGQLLSCKLHDEEECVEVLMKYGDFVAVRDAVSGEKGAFPLDEIEDIKVLKEANQVLMSPTQFGLDPDLHTEDEMFDFLEQSNGIELDRRFNRFVPELKMLAFRQAPARMEYCSGDRGFKVIFQNTLLGVVTIEELAKRGNITLNGVDYADSDDAGRDDDGTDLQD